MTSDIWSWLHHKPRPKPSRTRKAARGADVGDGLYLDIFIMGPAACGATGRSGWRKPTVERERLWGLAWAVIIFYKEAVAGVYSIPNNRVIKGI